MRSGRPVGVITRGTTNPNRLRRVDSWLVAALGDLLRAAEDPLVVDLGYGARPITAVQLRQRLARVRPDVRVAGVEIDPERVAAGLAVADPPGLTFHRGGFELAGLRPIIVRGLNVLRQYDESAVAGAWRTVAAALAAGGVLIDGTCDELGRLGSWLTVGADAEPRTLTLAADLRTLDRPAEFAERLPKALIHHNTPGQAIHTLLAQLDHAWLAAAPLAPFGPRQRFARAVAATRAAGWPIRYQPTRWRRGELTLRWTGRAR
jgi:hypothetical protein